MNRTILHLSLAAVAMLSLAVLPAQAASFSASHEVASYDEAEAAPNFIKFHMESTKLGMFTTSFDGFVKSFSVAAEVDEAAVTGVRLEFPVLAMDTDNGMRNEKMFEESLDAATFPKMTVALTAPVRLDGSVQGVPASLTVRGKAHPIEVKVSVEEQGEAFLVLGEAQVSLSGLEIPDPSILIASVNDTVGVSFRLTVRKDSLARF